jgi:hypothetical protein
MSLLSCSVTWVLCSMCIKGTNVKRTRQSIRMFQLQNRWIDLDAIWNKRNAFDEHTTLENSKSLTIHSNLTCLRVRHVATIDYRKLKRTNLGWPLMVWQHTIEVKICHLVRKLTWGTHTERDDFINPIYFIKKEIFSAFVHVIFTHASTVIIDVARYKPLETTTSNTATKCWSEGPWAKSVPALQCPIRFPAGWYA